MFLSRPLLPRPTYLPLPTMLAVQMLVWLTENRVVANPKMTTFFASLPLGSMWAVVIAFTLGLFLQDLYNPKSWVRQYVRRFKRVFKIDAADFPHECTEAVEWIHFRVRLRFVRNIRAAISVRIFHNAGARRLDVFRLPGLTKKERHTDDIEELVLATIPLKAYDGAAPGYATWTPDLRREHDPAVRNVIAGSEYVVEVEAKSCRGLQVERVLLAIPFADSQSFGRLALVDGNFITIVPQDGAET